MFNNIFKKFFNKELEDKLIELKSSHNDLVLFLDKMNKTKSGAQTKEDLLNFPLLEWVDLNKYISIRRRNMRFGNYLNFETIVKKDGKFNDHFHPDLIESTEITFGNMIDLKTNLSYKKFDVVHYDKGVEHELKALEDSRLNVIFKP